MDEKFDKLEIYNERHQPFPASIIKTGKRMAKEWYFDIPQTKLENLKGLSDEQEPGFVYKYCFLIGFINASNNIFINEDTKVRIHKAILSEKEDMLRAVENLSLTKDNSAIIYKSELIKFVNKFFVDAEAKVIKNTFVEQ